MTSVGATTAVSMADVAGLAGVSAGTVSRAMYRPEKISAATRERVMAAARQLGYVANGAARALAMRRTRTGGALVPRFGTSSFPTLVQAMESTLAAAGYTMLLSAPDHARAEDPALVRALLERGVDAVALLGAEQPPAVFSMLERSGIPFVLLWAQHSDHGTCIGFDEHAAAAEVVNHLQTLGHRRIAFIGGRTSDNERARRRLQGLQAAAAMHGVALPPDALIETEYGFEPGFRAMEDILHRDVRVSAIVCGNDYLACGALSALSRRGIAVPEALSVASFNDNDFAAYLHPPLTTVRVPIREMGNEAALFLIASMDGKSPLAPSLLPVELIVRGSTGRASDG
jgi:LacI family transcriptional regulator